MSGDTELVVLQQDLAEERANLRTAASMITFCTATLAVGLALATKFMLGLFLVPLSFIGFVFGASWAVTHGRRARQLKHQIRDRSLLPVARLIDR